MAGHSKFANIKHRKAAQDKKRGNAFTKLQREILVAAKMGGGDESFNPRLRVAVVAAKAANMPKDRIAAAIKKGSDPAGGEDYEEMRYEGYAPGGIALIIECLTDNRNRSAGDVRAILNKAGGSLGESGSVAFQFERVGLILYPADAASEDAMLEAAIEAGASNCESDKNGHEVTTEPDDLHKVADDLEKKFGDPETVKLEWKARDTIPLETAEKAQKVLNLIDTLEEHDDVQTISANFDISDEIADQLE
jgi:YebC/PmpR family DNA-binding regulatory protein